MSVAVAILARLSTPMENAERSTGTYRYCLTVIEFKIGVAVYAKKTSVNYFY